jgi:hypothetical protein
VVGGLHRAELPQPPDLSKLPEQRTLRHLVASVDLLAVRGLGGVSGRRPRCLVEQRAGSAAFLVRQPLPRGHKVRGFVLHWLSTYQHTP